MKQLIYWFRDTMEEKRRAVTHDVPFVMLTAELARYLVIPRTLVHTQSESVVAPAGRSLSGRSVYNIHRQRETRTTLATSYLAI